MPEDVLHKKEKKNEKFPPLQPSHRKLEGVEKTLKRDKLNQWGIYFIKNIKRYFNLCIQ